MATAYADSRASQCWAGLPQAGRAQSPLDVESAEQKEAQLYSRSHWVPAKESQPILTFHRLHILFKFIEFYIVQLELRASLVLCYAFQSIYFYQPAVEPVKQFAHHWPNLANACVNNGPVLREILSVHAMVNILRRGTAAKRVPTFEILPSS